MLSRVVLLVGVLIAVSMVWGSVSLSENAQHPNAVYGVLFVVGVLLCFLIIGGGLSRLLRRWLG